MKKPIVSLLLIILAFSTSSKAEDQAATQVDKAVVGANFYINNGLGTGTFLPKNKRDPLFYSNFYLYPSITTPKFAGDRSLKFYSEIMLDVNWLEAKAPKPEQPARTPDFADLVLSAQVNNALNFKDAGFSFTPRIHVEVPTSSKSIISNRIFGFGADTSIKWTSGDLAIHYKPALVGYLHSAEYKSDVCKSPDDNEKLSNGKCKVKGQQTLARLKNGLYFDYTPGNHVVTAGIKTYHDFLRASGQEKALSIKTLGLVEYGYTVQTAVPVTLFFGVSTLQPTFAESGALNFPFYDFKTPESNNSEIYFAIDFSV